MKNLLIGIVIALVGVLLWTTLTKPAIAQTKTVVVNKVSARLVSSNGEGQGKYSITLQCVLNIDGSPEYMFNISQDYLMGDSISDVYQKFNDAMQKKIDKYKAEQKIYNHTQLDAIATALSGNLSW